MTRQRLAQRPNRSRSRTWIRAMRFCQVSTPAHSRAFSASATVLAGALGLGGDRLVGREAAAGAAVVEAPEQGLQHLQEGAGDRAFVLARLAVSGAPGAGVGQDAGLGVAVQRHGAAGAKDLLTAVTSHGRTSGRWRR